MQLHSDPLQVQEFQGLATTLFQPKEESGVPNVTMSEEGKGSSLSGNVGCHHYSRSMLFDRLTQFFHEHMTQPRGNLVDLTPY